MDEPSLSGRESAVECYIFDTNLRVKRKEILEEIMLTEKIKFKTSYEHSTGLIEFIVSASMMLTLVDARARVVVHRKIELLVVEWWSHVVVVARSML